MQESAILSDLSVMVVYYRMDKILYAMIDAAGWLWGVILGLGEAVLWFFAAFLVGGGLLLFAAGAGAWAREIDFRKENNRLLIALALVAAVASLRFSNEFYWRVIDDWLDIDTVHWFSFWVAVAGIVLFYYRTKYQEQQINNQIEQTRLQKQQFNHQRKESRKKDEEIRKQYEEKAQKEADDKFRSDIKSLSSIDPLVCIQSMQSLHNIAMKDMEYSKRVASTLCSHIRSATRKAEYQKDNELSPSDEIQTAIDLLFRDVNGIEGLYKNPKIAAALPNADLSRAYLVGANLSSGYLAGADFVGAICRKADFSRAQCQGAIFKGAKCQKANFSKANCMGANFEEIHCQWAVFNGAPCQGAIFTNANCQGAYFLFAKCQGANFNGANCQGAEFLFSNCQGANLGKMNCQGANFQHANCQGAHALDENTYAFGLDLAIIDDLEVRIGKETEIKNMVFSGQITSECMKSITEAKEFLDESWWDKMQKIIEDNKDKPISYDMPQDSGMITGKLEDSEDLRKIIEDLRELEDEQEQD